MKKNKLIAAISIMLLLGAVFPCYAEDSSAGQVETENLAPQIDVLSAIEGMEPVTGKMLMDGMYSIDVLSSSSMFKIEECLLMVEDGTMTARMTMGGTGYLYLYMGTGQQAAQEKEESFLPFEEDALGRHTFTLPVSALDQAVECAAYSKRKEKWYDRTLVFSSGQLPDEAFQEGVLHTISSLGLADGSYEIEVTLGSEKGQAKVDSPAVLTVKDHEASATVVFSSGKYDYLLIGGEKVEAEEGKEKPTFEIPVTTLDRKIPIIADSTVMIPATEIAYTLTFDSGSIR